MLKKKIFYIIIILLLSNPTFSIENQILLKINEKIITTLDVKQELNYLKAINPGIKNFEEKKIQEIAINSLSRDIIKEIEILKYTDKISINDDDFEKYLSSSYSKVGVQSKIEFENYIKSFGLNLSFLRKKISIEIFWNQLIFQKYNSKVKIDEKLIRNNISKNIMSNSYDLSEIIFQLNEKETLESKYNLIKKDIENVGFEKAALQYSISQSSKNGGKIGWVNENSLNQNINKLISNLNKNEISKPQIIPGGFLILKFSDIKKVKLDIDLDKEIQNIISTQKNDQLSQYSNIFYNKIKMETKIEKY